MLSRVVGPARGKELAPALGDHRRDIQRVLAAYRDLQPDDPTAVSTSTVPQPFDRHSVSLATTAR